MESLVLLKQASGNCLADSRTPATYSRPFRQLQLKHGSSLIQQISSLQSLDIPAEKRVYSDCRMQKGETPRRLVVSDKRRFSFWDAGSRRPGFPQGKTEESLFPRAFALLPRIMIIGCFFESFARCSLQ
jgi:hypothetical protein